MNKKWIIFITIFLILTLLNFDQPTYFNEDVSSEVTAFHRSEDEIRAKWKQYSPKYNGDPYKEEPNSSYPYRKGKLESEFIEDGINMANFVRYLAGLPDDLELDYVLNNQAQYGAVLLAATKELTHDPPRPNDMRKSFYDIGHKSTTRSNVASGIYSLSEAVIGYMMDFGDSNLENVGHRRWILNPQMKRIGFGYYDGYSTMEIFDEARNGKYDFDYITYPTEGNFPSDIFYASCCPYGSNPWSIILNPEIYDNKRISEIRVELIDLNHSLVWRFCPRDTDSDCEKYFKVDTTSCGVPFCIIFRPDDIYDYEDGCKYKVKVTGLYTIEEEEIEIEYIVNFFEL